MEDEGYFSDYAQELWSTGEDFALAGRLDYESWLVEESFRQELGDDLFDEIEDLGWDTYEDIPRAKRNLELLIARYGTPFVDSIHDYWIG